MSYGAPQVWFYNASLQRLYDNGGSLSTTTGDGSIIASSVRMRQQFRRISWGSFRIPPDDVANYPLIQVGHIAVMHTSVHTQPRRLGAFTIKEVNIIVDGNVPMLEIAGPGLEDELARTIVTTPIGWQSINTELIAANFGADQTALWVEDSTGFEDGDDLSIRLYSDESTRRPGIPNRAVLWRGVQIGNPDVDDFGSLDRIDIDPPPGFAGLGNKYILQASDYRNPTTADITAILAFAGWSVTVQGGGSGTQTGTSHPANGSTVMELLNTTADITGEWWRPSIPFIGSSPPTRELEWRQSSDSSGVTLVMPGQATVASLVTSTSHAIIESFSREYSDERVSKIYPTGGGSSDGSISLLDLPSGTTPSAGFTLDLNYETGMGGLSYNTTAAALAPVVRSEIVDFPNISPEGISEGAREVAAEQLLAAAEEYLLARNEAFRFYRVTCVSNVSFKLGQTVDFEWADHNLDLDIDDLYIIEINTQVGDDGVIRDALVLSEVLIPRIKGAALLVDMVANAGGLLRTTSSPSVGFRPNLPVIGAGYTDIQIGTSAPPGALTLAGNELSFAAYSDAGAGNRVMATNAQGGAQLNRLGLGTAMPDAAGHLWLTGDLKFDGEQTINTLTASKLWIKAGADIEIEPVGDLILDPAGKDLLIGSNTRMRFVNTGNIDTDAGALTLQAATDLVLDPDSNSVKTAANVDILTNDFSGGFLGTGWRITDGGVGEFRTLIADELHVTHFTMEHAVATGRSLWITPGASKLTRDFTVPIGLSATTTIYVEDIPGAPGVQVFPTDSYVMLRYFRYEQPDGHLEIYNIWGQVSGYSNLPNSSEQSYTFTSRWYGNYESGTHSGNPNNQIIARGAPVLGFGSSGDGFVAITAADHESDPNTPNIRVVTWTTNPYQPIYRKLRVAIGNIHGATDAEEYGFWVGDGTGSDDAQIMASDVTGLQVNNVPILITDSGSPRIKLDPTVPSIAIGSGLPTAPQAGGDGFWVGLHDGQYMARIGGTPTSSKPALIWNGNSLSVRNTAGDPVMVFDGSGDSYFAGEMSVGAGGSIVAGETVFDEDGLQVGSADFGTGSNPDQRVRFMHGGSQVGAIEGFGNAYEGVYMYGGPSIASNYGMVTISDVDGVVLTSDMTTVTADMTIGSGLCIGSADDSDLRGGVVVMEVKSGTGTGTVPTPASGVALFHYNGYFYYRTAGGTLYQLNRTAV